MGSPAVRLTPVGSRPRNARHPGIEGEVDHPRASPVVGQGGSHDVAGFELDIDAPAVPRRVQERVRELSGIVEVLLVVNERLREWLRRADDGRRDEEADHVRRS